MTNDEAKADCIKNTLAQIGVRELCEREGFTVEAISIVRFHDTHTHLRWFYRQVETIAYVGELCEGGKPIDASGLLAFVRDTYGPDAHALY